MPATIEDCREPRPARRPALRSGFTLIEIMVAVGAIALVAVGLASIFDAVGKTVSGGRRTSSLSRYATLLESQMRHDFDGMTRDGFLVIRQQWTDGVGTPGGVSPDGLFDPGDASDQVPLYPDDPAPRGRRIDEILFFSSSGPDGELFRTRNQSVVPGVTVTSETAMIYLGHGQPRRVDAGVPYVDPRIDDLNADGATILGAADALGTPPEDRNPNRFASNWILTRRATLLVPLESAPIPFNVGTTPPLGLRPNQVANQDGQVGLLPAAASIFRSYNRAFPLEFPGATDYVRPPFAETGPMLASGLVDIATTDLAEIRRIVMSSVADPVPPPTNPFEVFLLPRDIIRDTNLPPNPSGRFVFVAAEDPAPNRRADPPLALDGQHAWMADAFPTQSDPRPDIGNDYPADDVVDPQGVRVRVESQARNFLETISRPDPLESITARADQLMLTSGALLPHCSEFIVEWSFGQIDALTNETLWYGPSRRPADTSGDGQIDVASDASVTTPYPKNDDDRLPVPFRRDEFKLNRGEPYVSQHLIYGRAPREEDAVHTSYFGYIDPTISPTAPGGTGGPAADGVIPWAWPRMIRITVSLTDAIDPSIESTFQFIFDVPNE